MPEPAPAECCPIVAGDWANLCRRAYSLVIYFISFFWLVFSLQHRRAIHFFLIFFRPLFVYYSNFHEYLVNLLIHLRQAEAEAKAWQSFVSRNLTGGTLWWRKTTNEQRKYQTGGKINGLITLMGRRQKQEAREKKEETTKKSHCECPSCHAGIGAQLKTIWEEMVCFLCKCLVAATE